MKSITERIISFSTISLFRQNTLHCVALNEQHYDATIPESYQDLMQSIAEQSVLQMRLIAEYIAKFVEGIITLLIK